MNYQVVLDCFKGDLAILYHLCRCNEIDTLSFNIHELLDKILQTSNQTLFQRALNICILANLLELKVKKSLGLFEKNDREYIEDLELALKLNCKQEFLDWRKKVLETFTRIEAASRNFVLVNLTSKRMNFSLNSLYLTAKKLLKSPSIFEGFFKCFISSLAQKIKDVTHYRNVLVNKLKHCIELSFKSVIKTREDAIGIFLASLELHKEGNLRLIQLKDDIIISSKAELVGARASNK